MALGDEKQSCCDAFQFGDLVDCTEDSSDRKRKRTTNTQIRGENRRLDGQSDYTYYVISASPSSDGPLYAASSRSPAFSSRTSKKQ